MKLDGNYLSETIASYPYKYRMGRPMETFSENDGQTITYRKGLNLGLEDPSEK
jgi:hypothetical protein